MLSLLRIRLIYLAHIQDCSISPKSALIKVGMIDKNRGKVRGKAALKTLSISSGYVVSTRAGGASQVKLI